MKIKPSEFLPGGADTSKLQKLLTYRQECERYAESLPQGEQAEALSDLVNGDSLLVDSFTMRFPIYAPDWQLVKVSQ